MFWWVLPYQLCVNFAHVNTKSCKTKLLEQLLHPQEAPDHVDGLDF